MSEKVDLAVFPHQSNPKDTIQQIIWSRNSNMLLTIGWDATLRIYSILKTGLELIFSKLFQDPILSATWDEQNNIIYLGFATGHVIALQLSTNQIMTILELQSPIVKVFLSVLTSSLVIFPIDKYFVIHRLNNSNDQNRRIIEIDDKIVCAAFSDPYFVFATNQQQYGLMNLENLSYHVKPPMHNSPLGKLSRITCIHINLAKKFLIFGSFDGRAGIVYFQSDTSIPNSKILIFKSQYSKETEYSTSNINELIKLYHTSSVDSHPVHPTKILCSGGFGEMHIYDYISRNQHLKLTCSAPVSEARFSPDGNWIAYSLGSVWEHGLNELGLYKPGVFVHLLKENWQKQG